MASSLLSSITDNTGTSINFIPSNWLSYIHLLVYSVMLGTMIFHSFVSGILLYQRLPKQQFALVQSILFPVYFTLNSIGLIVLLGIQYTQYKTSHCIQLILLTVLSLFSLTNQLYVGPATTKLMFRRQSLEKDGEKNGTSIDAMKNDAEYKKVASEFGKMHGISSLLNLLIVIGLVIHGIYLSNTLGNTSNSNRIWSKMKL